MRPLISQNRFDVLEFCFIIKLSREDAVRDYWDVRRRGISFRFKLTLRATELRIFLILPFKKVEVNDFGGRSIRGAPQ